MVSLPVAGMPGLLVVGQMPVDLVIVHRVVPGYLVGGGAQIVAVGLRVGSLAGVGGFVNRVMLSTVRKTPGRPGESSGM